MNPQPLDRRFCIAPMMDWSDRHCRYFWRQLTRRALLYTEMVTANAILHAGPERFLRHSDCEHPLALQLGGSDPQALGRCARIAEQWGFDEVNLNCGCPSDRVQNGLFGACLMAHPQRVADCIKAMLDACSIPVTVKHRIGIDEQDDYSAMRDFVGTIAETGCDTFIVHARKAWLQGLSPKENRDIPPLQYERVHRLKREFPTLTIVINGGITTVEQCEPQLEQVDGVMLGRAAYHNPLLLAEVDRRLFGADTPAPTAAAAIDAMLPYVQREVAAGTPLIAITRHLLGLYQGVRGARRFRRHLSENAHKPGAGADVLLEAFHFVCESGVS